MKRGGGSFCQLLVLSLMGEAINYSYFARGIMIWCPATPDVPNTPTLAACAP